MDNDMLLKREHGNPVPLDIIHRSVLESPAWAGFGWDKVWNLESPAHLAFDEPYSPTWLVDDAGMVEDTAYETSDLSRNSSGVFSDEISSNLSPDHSTPVSSGEERYSSSTKSLKQSSEVSRRIKHDSQKQSSSESQHYICKGCNTEFGSKANLRWHYKDARSKRASRTITCPFTNCKRNQMPFSRQWNMKEHVRRNHPKETLDSESKIPDQRVDSQALPRPTSSPLTEASTVSLTSGELPMEKGPPMLQGERSLSAEEPNSVLLYILEAVKAFDQSRDQFCKAQDQFCQARDEFCRVMQGLEDHLDFKAQFKGTSVA